MIAPRYSFRSSSSQTTVLFPPQQILKVKCDHLRLHRYFVVEKGLLLQVIQPAELSEQQRRRVLPYSSFPIENKTPNKVSEFISLSARLKSILIENYVYEFFYEHDYNISDVYFQFGDFIKKKEWKDVQYEQLIFSSKLFLFYDLKQSRLQLVYLHKQSKQIIFSLSMSKTQENPHDLIDPSEKQNKLLPIKSTYITRKESLNKDATFLLEALDVQAKLQFSNSQLQKTINVEHQEEKRECQRFYQLYKKKADYFEKDSNLYQQNYTIQQQLENIIEQDNQFDIFLQEQFYDLQQIHQRQLESQENIRQHRIQLEQILVNQCRKTEQQKLRQIPFQQKQIRIETQLIEILQKQLVNLKKINAQLTKQYELLKEKISNHYGVLKKKYGELGKKISFLEEQSQRKRKRQMSQKVISVQQILQVAQLPKDQLNNLLILSISNKSSSSTNFMTPKEAKILSQIPLPNLKELELQNNYILDEGLQYLSKAQFPQLTKINLNDNKITIEGLNHLYQNNWPLSMKYYLDSVQLLNGGYQLKVSQYINTIKTIKTTVDKQFDKLYQNNSEDHIISALNLLMITPNEDKQKKLQKSQQILAKQKQKALKNQKSIAMIILKLKQLFKDRLILQQKFSLKSKISSNILFTGSNNKRIRVTETFKNDFSNDFSFQKFDRNASQINRFLQWFYDRNQKQFGLNKQNIIVHSITQGSIKLDFSLNQQDAAALPQSYKKMLQFSSFFKEFYLTEDVFDSKGNYNFPKKPQDAEVQERGGYPYYQPIFGTGFGIKVMNLYQDNNWLAMDRNPNQWAIVFHGVNNPAQKIASGNSVFQSILQGREKGEMLVPGGRQACKYDICHRTKQAVGDGIYTSPYFLTSLYDYACQKVGDYHLVLQCRAKPDKIKFTSRDDYWVINSPKDLRPYRIILFTDEEIRKLKNISSCQTEAHKKIYKTQFNYLKWIQK